jgi:hypothetical protein
MLKVVVTLLIATSVLAVSLSVVTSKLSPYAIVGTFNIANNDSLSQMDLDSGKLVKINNIGAIIEAYFYSVYDPSQRMLYALGIGGDSSFVDVFHADNLTFVNEIYFPGNYPPIEMHYDPRLSKFFGMVYSEPLGHTAIAAYNMKNGAKEDLVALTDIEAINEYSSAYDMKNSFYYASIISTNMSALQQYYQVDVVQKKIIKKITVKSTLDNAQFDPTTNQIIGVVNDIFTTIDVASGQSTTYPQLDLSSVGFRELGASAFDHIQRQYHILYENHKAQTHMIKIDLKTLTYKIEPFYDHSVFMEYIY